MSRLLFAAARGARIEQILSGKRFRGNIISDALDQRTKYRIHPDDEHLQYGPISSALREQAAHVPEISVAIGMVPFIFWQATNTLPADELHRSLFLLILAEALADEGL